MYRGELPGYFWDEEKRKYFRVQANHYSGAPPNANYTKAKVEKTIIENKKRKREETWQKQRKRYLIQRAAATEIPRAAQVGVRSEVGNIPRSTVLQERSEAFTRSLEQNILLDLHNEVPAWNGYVSYRPDYQVSYFDYDKATQGLLLGMAPTNDSSYDSVVSVLPDSKSSNLSTEDRARDPEPWRPKYSWFNIRPVSVFQSPLSSININPSTRTLVTTSTGDRHPPAVQISQLVSPENAVSSQPLDSAMSSLFRPPNLATIFCSAINPWVSANSEEHVAVGSSGGSGVVFFGASNKPETGSRNWRSLPAMKTYSDVLALDWLSPHLLTAGLRDASVVLYDVRAQQGIKRMKHSGGVISLKRADSDTRFVVAGMGGQMALYDLRALRQIDAGGLNSWTLGDKAKSKAKAASTRKTLNSMETEAMPVAKPVLKFDYNNQYDMLGMDVSADLRMVAAAEEGGFLRMSSLQTGKTVKRWKLGKSEGDRVRWVRFVDDDVGVPRLMASCGPRIVELAW